MSYHALPICVYGVLTFYQEVNCDKCKPFQHLVSENRSHNQLAKPLHSRRSSLQTRMEILLQGEAIPSKYLLILPGRLIANNLRYVSFAWKDPKNITDELNSS